MLILWVCTNDEATAVVGTDALVFGITSVIGAAGADTQIQFNSGGSSWFFWSCI